MLSSKTLQEELKKKAAALSDVQQHLERCEQEAAALKGNLDKVTQEGKDQRAELSRKVQSLVVELLKVQKEKEAQRKELDAAEESLEKADQTLKESRTQLDSERKNHKSAMDEKVGCI